jgi:hydrogenase maturation protease
MRTIIIGIGNPVLTDDSVGIRIARELESRLSADPDIVISELCAGGLRLVEAMAGYDRAIIIDAIVSQGDEPGSVLFLDPSQLRKTRNAGCTHDASLVEALELGAMAGLRLPGEIKIWAIEAGDTETFSECLTEPVERAVPKVVEDVVRYIGANRGLAA